MKRALICLTFVLQFVMAASPFIPFVRQNIFESQASVSGFAGAVATYIGIQFICLSFLVTLLLMDFKSQATKDIAAFGGLLQRYTPLHVRQLRENEFYKDFLGHCVRASHYVNICYFSPRPPAVGGSPERMNYYAKIAATMRENPDTRFRRIVRDTPANRAWIFGLVSELEDTNNSSIAMLSDFEDTVELGSALSVQIVDGTIAWLVAVAEHAGAEMYRDIAIENEVVVEVLNKYFDRLWHLSLVVFAPGYDLERCRQAMDRGN
jgi:hypothetical protein